MSAWSRTAAIVLATVLGGGCETVQPALQAARGALTRVLVPGPPRPRARPQALHLAMRPRHSAPPAPRPASETAELDIHAVPQPVLDAETIRRHIGVLASRPRWTEDEKADARDYLRDQYRRLDMQVELDDYGSGTNVVATVGRAPPKVIVTSHYDTVPSTVGADDNASGVAVSLALAEALRDREGLMIVHFDEEEAGMRGSRRFVARLRSQERLPGVAAAINLDMIGHDGSGEGVVHVIDCNRFASRALRTRLVAALSDHPYGLRHVPLCVERSDNVPFWDLGVPAVHVLEDFRVTHRNPCYHRPCDDTEKVDVDFARRVGSAAAHVVDELLAADRRATSTE